MARPVTLFTGQWADIPFAQLCKTVKDMGYDGVEIACWGDHMDPTRAVKDSSYVQERKDILSEHGLSSFALGAHLAGQCVGDYNDPRLDAFAPKKYSGKPDEIRKWAIEEMKATAGAAAKMGCKVVTGFMGSPIWKYLYSFPPTSEEMVEQGYQEVKELWTPIFDEFDKVGVKFALEVHPSEIAYDYWSTVKLFEVFEDRPTLGINFDPSHLIWQGVTPHLFLRDFAKKTYHVHMKDAATALDGRSGILGSHLQFGDSRRGWNFRSIGHGQVDFDAIIRELNDMNYSGPLSVEWEDNGMDRIFGATESAQYVHKINFSPSDVKFDGAMES